MTEEDAVAGKSTAGDDWTSWEVEAVVSDYREMLRAELSGVPYNKSEHRRLLMQTVKRSEASIEFKHHNISAVLEEIGLPWIKGYKPRHNYQGSLVPFVEKLIADNADSLPATPPSVESNPEHLFVLPPVKIEQPSPPPATVRLAHKIDQAARDNRNRKLGAQGEEFVFETEKKRLASLPHLAARVKWVSRDEGDGLGYDVRSCDAEGNELLIEVKTTCGGIKTPFFISSGELTASEQYGAKYRLYRVFEFGPAPLIYRLRPPLAESIKLAPSVFRASFS